MGPYIVTNRLPQEAEEEATRNRNRNRNNNNSTRGDSLYSREISTWCIEDILSLSNHHQQEQGEGQSTTTYTGAPGPSRLIKVLVSAYVIEEDWLFDHKKLYGEVPQVQREHF